jgi:hypothetical protein
MNSLVAKGKEFLSPVPKVLLVPLPKCLINPPIHLVISEAVNQIGIDMSEYIPLGIVDFKGFSDHGVIIYKGGFIP